jgi:hypothetical protein
MVNLWEFLMGGAGSGRPKTRERVLVEDCESLNINEITKYGFTLYPAFAFVEADSNEKYLSIRLIHDSDGRLVPSKQIIQLIETYPYFGGIRYLMKCPNCNKRVGKLYKPLYKNQFRCRECYDLQYRSTQSNVYDSWLKRTRFTLLSNKSL